MYVYIFVSQKHNLLKIGRTNSISKRFSELQKIWNFFEIENSFFLKVETSYSSKLEKTLHNLCADHKLEMNENYNGCDEFFSYNIHDTLKSFIVNTLPLFKANVKIEPLQETIDYYNSMKEYNRIVRMCR
ncbi:GIY-YIG nuclease family protein [Aliarcobacter butzleri]|uniref:GIY-YIG nuclease family protein n=1 Tax=Aliarcobacter butzleri TaxID=28197 RepID=UPI0021B473EB|nr:GIY-YIG nuclease family protein [Aliarcobacter butzleri]MCT7596087.1 GIY-YIG nuclease family protein [Aliarcobacter butzleri]